MHDIVQRAKQIKWKERKEIIMQMNEAKELIPALVNLFEVMEPDYPVVKTHGVSEFGKDIVIIRKDKIRDTAIAVVVKRGSIAGKTLGDVDDVKERVKNIFNSKEQKAIDEIQSQIEQSNDIPANLACLYNKIKINEVWVVLAGDLSDNAKTRIKEGVDKKINNIEMFDIIWLVDNFTEYYPHVFFNMEINEFLDTKIRELENCSSLKNEDSLILSDVFVPPVLTKDSFPEISQEKDISDFIRKKLMKKEKMSFNSIEEVVKSRNVVITGNPGTGKTAALYKIAIDDLSKSLSKNIIGKKNEIVTPILVHSKEMLVVEDTEQLKKNYYNKYYDALKDSKINKIIVDAIDEIDSDDRERVINKALQFSKDIGSSLIFSSRKVGCISCVPKDFEKYEILPLEFSQAMKLIKAYLKDDEEKLKIIEEKIKEINLPILPLSLTLLVKVIKEYDEIPASITELYNRFFEIVLGRHDYEKGISVLFDYPVRRSLLNTLAYEEMLDKGRTTIKKDDFEVFYQEYSNEYIPDNKFSPNDFLLDIERAGVIEIKDNKISFFHKTFLEFFAANYIFNHREEFDNVNEIVSRVYFDDLWGETAFFFCGMKKQVPEKVFSQIFNNKSEELSDLMNKFIAPRLLQAGNETKESIKLSTIKNSLNNGTHFKREFMKVTEDLDFRSDFLSDIMLLNMSIYSLSSMFLINGTKEAIKYFISSDADINSYYSSVFALAGVDNKINAKEKEEIISLIVDNLVENSKISMEDKSKVLLYLSKMENDKDVSIRYATKKLNRVIRKHKELLKIITITNKTINRISKGYKG